MDLCRRNSLQGKWEGRVITVLLLEKMSMMMIMKKMMMMGDVLFHTAMAPPPLTACYWLTCVHEHVQAMVINLYWHLTGGRSRFVRWWWCSSLLCCTATASSLLTPPLPIGGCLTDWYIVVMLAVVPFNPFISRERRGFRRRKWSPCLANPSHFLILPAFLQS